MSRQTRKLSIPERLYRPVEFKRDYIDEEKRTVRLTLSSDAPYEGRWWGTEILDHKKSSIRLGRLRTAGPCLFNHLRDQHLGRIEDVRVLETEGKLEVEIRFSKSAFAEEKWQDVLDEILREVSVGYTIHAMVLEKEEDGVATYRVTDWEPLEGSFVTIPADITVGVGRSEAEEDVKYKELEVLELEQELADATSELKEMQTRGVEPPEPKKKTPKVEVKESNKMPEGNTITEEQRDAAVQQAQETASGNERLRTSAIYNLGYKHGIDQKVINEHIGEGKSLEDFQAHVLNHKLKLKEITSTPEVDPNIGMSGKDLSRYSMRNAIHQIASGKGLDGIEKEASDAVAKRIGRTPEGFFVPFDVSNQKRDLTAGTGTAGGHLVETSLLTGSFIELLYEHLQLIGIGAEELHGLVGDVAIPKMDGGATAQWVAEDGTVTGTDQTFAQLGLTPKRLGALTAFTKQLINQSHMSVENLIRANLATVCGEAITLAAIAGTGASNQPTGIINTTGVQTITFGASTAPTYAKYVEAWRKVQEANVVGGKKAFLTSPLAQEKALTIPRVAGHDRMIIDDDFKLLGTTVHGTNHAISDKLIYGAFNNLLIAFWGAMDFVVDPYSLAASGKIKIVLNMFTDIGIKHPSAFVVSTDSAAQ